jgi:hypothetical protein
MSPHHLRAVLFGLVGAVALFSTAPIVSLATSGPSKPTLVRAQTDTRTFRHPCHDSSGVATCSLVVTTTVPSHYVFPDGNPSPLTPGLMQAQACYNSTYYIWPSMHATDHTGWGTVATQINLSAENWYNGCSSGAVWVDFNCTATPGWGCDSAAHGGFWDGGYGYYQDWGNQDTHNYFGAGITWYLRLHVYPSGSFVRWCYDTGSGSC